MFNCRGDPSPEIFLLFDLKMEHFGAVFNLDFMEERRTQLQEQEAIAMACHAPPPSALKKCSQMWKLKSHRVVAETH